ncbi:3'-5' exoribonuclease 1 [Nowakowskiella sp. JEL0407]|nr:3'-5' exoribonuclease 1 [Nowakowskiella sp. JEL0407]
MFPDINPVLNTVLIALSVPIIVATPILAFVLYPTPRVEEYKDLPHLPKLQNIWYRVFSKKGYPEMYQEFIKKNKTAGSEAYVSNVTRKWQLTLESPDDIRYLFANTDKFPKFDFTKFVPNSIAATFLGSNIVFLNGSEWKRHRKVSNPAFHKTKALPAVFGKCGAILLKEWEKIEAKTGGVLDVHVWMQRLTLDALGAAAFTTNFGALEDDNSELVATYVIFPFIQYLPIPSVQRVFDDIKKFDAMIVEKLDERRMIYRKFKEEGKEYPEELKDLIMVEEVESSEESSQNNLTLKEIRNDLVIFFVAGHDTTSASLSFALYFLSKYKDIQDKARAEVQRIMGDAPADTVPTFEQQSEMTYLTQVIKESLRMYPPAALLPQRIASQDVVLPSGIVVRQGIDLQVLNCLSIKVKLLGCFVTVDIYAMQHSEKHWEDPEKFNPDRFTSEKSIPFHAFGGGSRLCLGQNFSLIEQRIILTMILRNYEMTLPEDSIHKDIIRMKKGTIMAPKELNIKFKRRNKPLENLNINASDSTTSQQQYSTSARFAYLNERLSHHIPKKSSRTEYRYLCVLDFEATCEKDSGFDFENEIIEFPVVLINIESNLVDAEFHKFVRPSREPILSDFCKELTGISQSQIDRADTFPKVLDQLEEWLSAFSEFPYDDMMFVTDGPWDLRDFLRKQCNTSKVSRPSYLYKFVDLRLLFSQHYKHERAGLNLEAMLSIIGRRFEGRQHSGIEDTRNIARIVQHMIAEGVKFSENSVILNQNRKRRRAR